jgi:hypothetical protein
MGLMEKEAYSIVESMIRFDHIVGGRHVSHIRITLTLYIFLIRTIRILVLRGTLRRI